MPKAIHIETANIEAANIEAAHKVSVITYQTAASLLGAAMDHAIENGWSIAVVVLDPWGAQVASGRMDSVSPIVLDIAIDKAFTATLGKSTKDFYERMSSSNDLTLGLQTRPRLCAWEGGLPIFTGGRLIGAIGVSGAKGFEDVECAQTALNRLGLESVLIP